MNTENSRKPRIGMQFKTKEEKQDYFILYSKVVGFSGIIVAASKDNKQVTE